MTIDEKDRKEIEFEMLMQFFVGLGTGLAAGILFAALYMGMN